MLFANFTSPNKKSITNLKKLNFNKKKNKMEIVNPILKSEVK